MRIYYRGTKEGEKKRIKTGNDKWDNNLFCSTDKEKALWYGPDIEEILLKREANVLTEGSKIFSKYMPKRKSNESTLDWCTAVITEAQALKYDVVEFARQGDVGTVVMNEDMAIRNFQLK